MDAKNRKGKTIPDPIRENLRHLWINSLLSSLATDATDHFSRHGP
jgi:hypothetical protein